MTAGLKATQRGLGIDAAVLASPKFRLAQAGMGGVVLDSAVSR